MLCYVLPIDWQNEHKPTTNTASDDTEVNNSTSASASGSAVGTVHRYAHLFNVQPMHNDRHDLHPASAPASSSSTATAAAASVSKHSESHRNTRDAHTMDLNRMECLARLQVQVVSAHVRRLAVNNSKYPDITAVQRKYRQGAKVKTSLHKKPAVNRNHDPAEQPREQPREQPNQEAEPLSVAQDQPTSSRSDQRADHHVVNSVSMPEKVTEKVTERVAEQASEEVESSWLAMQILTELAAAQAQSLELQQQQPSHHPVQEALPPPVHEAVLMDTHSSESDRLPSHYSSTNISHEGDNPNSNHTNHGDTTSSDRSEDNNNNDANAQVANSHGHQNNKSVQHIALVSAQGTQLTQTLHRGHKRRRDVQEVRIKQQYQQQNQQHQIHPQQKAAKRTSLWELLAAPEEEDVTEANIGDVNHH